MGTAYGEQTINLDAKITKDNIQWIKNVAMEYMNGKMAGFIEEILKMTIAMVMDSSLMDNNAFIKVFGWMESNLKFNSLHSLQRLQEQQVYKCQELAGLNQIDTKHLIQSKSI